MQPLFHLCNGDLCYANLATDRVRTWSDFWENNTRSAKSRPWMPSAGNHGNEKGNGPIGTVLSDVLLGAAGRRADRRDQRSLCVMRAPAITANRRHLGVTFILGSRRL